MNSTKLTFTNAAGQELSSRLDMPADGNPNAYALFAHCFTCSKDLKAVRHISNALTGEGFAVLRFDFTGLGESAGDFSDTTFSSNIDDLLAAADYLETQYRGPQLLIGHSLGGAAVLQAASRIPASRAVVTIGAPAEPTHVTRHLQSSMDRIQTDGQAVVNLAGREFTIKKAFIDDLDQSRMEETIHELDRALLVMHAPLDDVVGIDNAARIFAAARHPKSYVSLDTADHLLSNTADSRYVGRVVASWAARYIQSQRADTHPAADANHVTVRTGSSGFYTEIAAGPHHLVADEPTSVGGTDAGPTPYGLLVAALGACTTMTLSMYADRKGWPLESAAVNLKHQKIHARDCRECESETGYVDRIDRELELHGPLTLEQRERMLQIADRCPVHKTLHAEIRVDTRLREADTA